MTSINKINKGLKGKKSLKDHMKTLQSGIENTKNRKTTA